MHLRPLVERSGLSSKVCFVLRKAMGARTLILQYELAYLFAKVGSSCPRNNILSAVLIVIIIQGGALINKCFLQTKRTRLLHALQLKPIATLGKT